MFLFIVLDIIEKSISGYSVSYEFLIGHAIGAVVFFIYGYFFAVFSILFYGISIILILRHINQENYVAYVIAAALPIFILKNVDYFHHVVVSFEIMLYASAIFTSLFAKKFAKPLKI